LHHLFFIRPYEKNNWQMTYSHNLNVRALDGPFFSALEEFLAGKGAQRQYYTLDPNRNTIIEGVRGTRLHFPARALVDGRGQLVKNMVQIELIELFTIAEMVLANTPSTAENELLESGGQIAVFAHCEGNPVYLQQAVQVEMPVWGQPRNAVALSLYEQTISTMRTFSAESLCDWRKVGGSSIKVTKKKGVRYNLFSIERFNWYQCSYLPSKTKPKKKVMVSAYPLGVSSLDDQLGFMIFNDIHAVARMYWSGSHFTALNIPTRYTAEVFLLGLKNGQLFMGSHRFRKEEDKKLKVHLHPCSQIDIIEALQDI
jgi:hypothetical protein